MDLDLIPVTNRLVFLLVLKQPVKAGARPSMRAMASSILGGRAAGDDPNGAAGNDEGDEQPRGLAEMAFDFLANPFA